MARPSLHPASCSIAESASRSPADRLDSWKEVAAYLKRSMRTVRRWEAEQGLPVHRHVHQSGSTIYAFKAELDVWWANRAVELSPEQPATERSAAPATRRSTPHFLMASIGAIAAVLLSVTAYRATNGSSNVSGRKAAMSGRVMLAVLPFENLSRDPEQEYFSDGLTEEIITQLGQISPQRLGVIARTSVTRYRKGHGGIDQIARDLGVSYVLEGSVRRQADLVRVAVQLIRVDDQTPLWAASYDKSARDVLGLQAELAQAISRTIEIKLSPDASARLARVSAIDDKAHDAYLMGRYFWNRRTSGTIGHAIRYFEQATQLDPAYALAYAGLADCYAVLPNYSDMSDREAELKTEEAATKALRLDPNLGEPYATLAIVSEARWDWLEAERRFRHAIELSPNDATMHLWFADYFQQVGRLAEAAAELAMAHELDPLAVTVNAFVANQLYLERRYDDAIVQSRRVLDMEPTWTDSRSRLGVIFTAKGMVKEAMSEFRLARDLSPNDPKPIGLLGEAHALSGHPEEARRALQELGALRKRGQPRSDFYSAMIHIALGETDRGFDLLNRSVDEHTSEIGWLRSSPAFDGLRSDARYYRLIRRMNFPGS